MCIFASGLKQRHIPFIAFGQADKIRLGKTNNASNGIWRQRPRGTVLMIQGLHAMMTPADKETAVDFESKSGCVWQAPRRVSLNAAITCGSLERRLDDGASSPLIIHAFDVADQIADDF